MPVGRLSHSGLEPGTTYHYRLIVTNEVGYVESADHSFTTQLAGEELTSARWAGVGTGLSAR